MKSAVWIIGHQLDHGASSLAEMPGDCPVVMIESGQYIKALPHHWQKLVLIRSAMRHFADELRALGRTVHYFKRAGDFVTALRAFVRDTGVENLVVMEPNDHGLAKSLPALAVQVGCTMKVLPNNQFLIGREEFVIWAGSKKPLVMESFYRHQRKRLGILIESDGSPTGGAWNLDKLNRVGHVPALMPIPELSKPKLDAITIGVIDEVHQEFDGKYFGGRPTIQQMRDRFIWPVTAAEALAQLRKFLHERLESFGPFEDAMTTRSWSLWHSHLSVAMNCGLLHPQRVRDSLCGPRFRRPPQPVV